MAILKSLRHRPIARQALLAVALILTVCQAAIAADNAYPNRPVKWVVPFPPGGAMDSIARVLGQDMAVKLGQPFVIENRPGAGGNIGAAVVAKAPPDGYSMMIVSIGMATNKFLYPKLSYDPVKDFTPISLLAIVPNVLVANPSRVSAKTVQEVIAQAKADPGKFTFASAGNGTSIHLAGELFTAMAAVDMTHVPYKGSSPAITDLLGGQVDYMFDSISSARPYIQAGKLRPIAVTTRKRSPALPNVPTVAESGLPGYEVAPWFAVFMPAGTPGPIIVKIHGALIEAMKQPEVKARFESIGAETIGSTPEKLANHLNVEMMKWGEIIRERGIQAD